MNVIFKAEVNERGLLELRTADLNEENFQKLRAMLFQTKRIVIGTASGPLGTSLCATIDDSYEAPPIQSSGDKTTLTQEVHHCLRNLTELCNLDTEAPDLVEALLDRVMDGTLKLIYDAGQVLFQSSEVKQT